MNRVNPVKLIGEVRSIDLYKNSAVVRLDIDGNIVNAYAFAPVVPYVKLFKEGDMVKIDATLQSNDRRKNEFVAPRRIAINHIGPAKENSLPMNSWLLFGRPVNIDTKDDGDVVATIKTEGGMINYIRVEIPQEKAVGFNKLSRDNFIAISGEFRGGKCITKKWRHARPNFRNEV